MSTCSSCTFPVFATLRKECLLRHSPFRSRCRYEHSWISLQNMNLCRSPTYNKKQFSSINSGEVCLKIDTKQLSAWNWTAVGALCASVVLTLQLKQNYSGNFYSKKCQCSSLEEGYSSGSPQDLISTRVQSKEGNLVQEVYSWGNGTHGQLGQGDTQSRALPTSIKGINLGEGDFITRCYASNFHSCCLSNNGKLITWGKAQDNRLGYAFDESELSSLELQTLPRKVEPCEEKNLKIIQFSCGEGHMLVLDEKGKVYSWGQNNRGQCGRDTRKSNPVNDLWAGRAPNRGLGLGRVDGPLSDQKVSKLACSKNHSLALTEDGDLYSWGSLSDVYLGDDEEHWFPTKVDISDVRGKIIDIDCGNNFCALLTGEGELYTWGLDNYGQLGHGKQTRFLTKPKLVHAFASSNRVSKISCGQFHMGVITDKNQVYTWGYGVNGQCGHGSTADTSVPRIVEALKSHDAEFISCGGGHTAVILKDSSLYMFGRGRDGQYGRADHIESTTANRNLPLEVEYFRLNEKKVCHVSCGGGHTIAVVQSTT